MPENTYYNPRNDEVIASSREAAIVRLNTYPIEVGKTVYIKYYADLNKTCIDALVAIGITNGTGPGTYSIISDKGIALVTKIVLELPDVTELVHGQLYLYHDPATNLNYYVYLKTMTRIITLVKESVMLVTAETGKLWWVETSLLKDLTNFYTKEEIDAMDFNKNTYNYNYNIKKTYESVSLMQSDSSSPVGTNGLAIQIGDIVTVVNSTTPSENGIYSYEGAENGWKLQSSFNFQVEQSRSQNANTSPSSKLFDDKINELSGDIVQVETDLNAIAGKDYTSLMDVGYSLVPSSTIIGDIVTITRASNSFFNSIKINIKKGEIIQISGLGGGEPRMYYATDSIYKLKYITNIAASGTFEYTALEDGYLIANLRNETPSSPPILIAYSVYDTTTSIKNSILSLNNNTKYTTINGNILQLTGIDIGTTMSAGSLATGYPNRATTELLKNGDDLLFAKSNDNLKFTIRFALYANDGITMIGFDDEPNSNLTIPANSYFRLCFVKVEPGNIINTKEITDIVSLQKGITTNKTNVNVCGDSIVQGYVSYLSNGTPTSNVIVKKCWVTKLSEIRKDFSITNYGVGGQGYIDPAGTPEITARDTIDGIDFGTCNIALLAYGINDWKGNQIIGSVNDSPTLGTTVTSNMKYCIEKIISDNPACKIYIISPLNCMGYNFDFGDDSTNYALGYSGFANTGTLESFVSKMKEVAEYYGVEFIDMTHNSVVNRKSITSLLIDGVHPSEQCHLAIARELAYKI